jgi:hypothetical protein
LESGRVEEFGEDLAGRDSKRGIGGEDEKSVTEIACSPNLLCFFYS